MARRREAGRQLAGGALRTVSQGTGVLIGTVAGGAVAGPFGAALGAYAGAAATVMLDGVASDIEARLLSPLEKVRLERIRDAAATKLAGLLAAGKTLRQDGFFDADPPHRAAAAEVAEAVLRATREEHEERKLEHFAALLANIAVDSAVDRAQANWLVQLAGRLTYRQLCVLGLAGAGARAPSGASSICSNGRRSRHRIRLWHPPSMRSPTWVGRAWWSTGAVTTCHGRYRRRGRSTPPTFAFAASGGSCMASWIWAPSLRMTWMLSRTCCADPIAIGRKEAMKRGYQRRQVCRP